MNGAFKDRISVPPVGENNCNCTKLGGMPLVSLYIFYILTLQLPAPKIGFGLEFPVNGMVSLDMNHAPFSKHSDLREIRTRLLEPSIPAVMRYRWLLIYQKTVLMICPVGNQGAVKRDKRREWWKGREEVKHEPGLESMLKDSDSTVFGSRVGDEVSTSMWEAMKAAGRNRVGVSDITDWLCILRQIIFPWLIIPPCKLRIIIRDLLLPQ